MAEVRFKGGRLRHSGHALLKLRDFINNQHKRNIQRREITGARVEGTEPEIAVTPVEAERIFKHNELAGGPFPEAEGDLSGLTSAATTPLINIVLA